MKEQIKGGIQGDERDWEQRSKDKGDYEENKGKCIKYSDQWRSDRVRRLKENINPYVEDEEERRKAIVSGKGRNRGYRASEIKNNI